MDWGFAGQNFRHDLIGDEGQPAECPSFAGQTPVLTTITEFQSLPGKTQLQSSIVLPGKTVTKFQSLPGKTFEGFAGQNCYKVPEFAGQTFESFAGQNFEGVR